MIVGARESFLNFQTKYLAFENNRALSKFLYDILHYVTSIIKL